MLLSSLDKAGQGFLSYKGSHSIMDNNHRIVLIIVRGLHPLPNPMDTGSDGSVAGRTSNNKVDILQGEAMD